MKNKKVTLLSIVLVLAIGSFNRINANVPIKFIQFVSIFTIGALTALLINELATKYKSKGKE